MRILFLDDDSIRCNKFARNFMEHTVLFVHSADVCITALDQATEVPFDLVCLDHDLGDEIMVPSGPGTGYEVACWLEQHPDKQPKYIILHSFNPDGRMRMQQALPKAVCVPGVWEIDPTLVLDLLEHGASRYDAEG